MNTDDSEIVKRLQNGDQSALTMVLKDVVPALWPILARNFRESLSNEDIEEVIATALAKLWQGRAGFDSSKGDFQGWFYVILRNCALDRIRRNRPRVEEFLVVEPLPCSQEKSEDQTRGVVLEALATLSEGEREVLVPLFDRSGRSVSELSESLSMSTGAIRQLRFRALRKLNFKLAQQGYTTRRVRESSFQRKG